MPESPPLLSLLLLIPSSRCEKRPCQRVHRSARRHQQCKHRCWLLESWHRQSPARRRGPGYGQRGDVWSVKYQSGSQQLASGRVNKPLTRCRFGDNKKGLRCGVASCGIGSKDHVSLFFLLARSLSVSPSRRLAVSLSLSLSLLSRCLCLSLSLCLSVSMSLCLSVALSRWFSVALSRCLCASLSLYVAMFLCLSVSLALCLVSQLSMFVRLISIV